ncbi:MAG: aspartate 1-decarboxylase [Clostridiaceae bacterium]
MRLTMLKGKIHRATVTEANLNYVGSITIDEELMEKAGFFEYEKVHIADVDNGNRFETYIIAGERGSRIFCLNGAAARMVQKGDKIIIMAYCEMEVEEVAGHKPKVVVLGEENELVKVTNYEKHGEFA